MSKNAERVEIYSGIQRRRRYSVDQKLRIVQEAIRVDEEVVGSSEVKALERRIREAVKVAHGKN